MYLSGDEIRKTVSKVRDKLIDEICVNCWEYLLDSEDILNAKLDLSRLSGINSFYENIMVALEIREEEDENKVNVRK